MFVEEVLAPIVSRNTPRFKFGGTVNLRTIQGQSDGKGLLDPLNLREIL